MSFLALESLLIERLRSAMPDVRVFGAEDLQGVEERGQVTPALHVIFNGYRVTGNSPTGVRAEVEQSWLVVVVVRHDGSADQAAEAVKQRAAPYVDGVLGALMGYRISGVTPAPLPLKLDSAPKPIYRKPFYYLPLAITTQVVVSGA